MDYSPTPLDLRVFGRYLGEEEHLIAVIHKHWLAVVTAALQGLLLGVVLPLLLMWAFSASWWVALGTLLWIAIGAGWTGYVLFDWFADAFVLTNENVLLLTWKNPVSATFTRIEYTLIEAVEHQRSGVIETVFQYGTLKLTTANDTHTLTHVPRPHLAENRLQEIRDQIEENGKQGDHHMADFETLKRALRALMDEENGIVPEEKKPRPPDPPSVRDVGPPA